MKLYQSDRRCLKASIQLNRGIRKVGLLALKIILDRSKISYLYFHLATLKKLQSSMLEELPKHTQNPVQKATQKTLCTTPN